jgi:hypothetical protein
MEANTKKAVRLTRARVGLRHLRFMALLVLVSIGVSACIVVPLGHWGHGGHHGGHYRDRR